MSIQFLNDSDLESVVGANNAVVPPTPSTPANGQLLASSQEPATPPMGDLQGRFKTFDQPYGNFITTSVLFA